MAQMFAVRALSEVRRAPSGSSPLSCSTRHPDMMSGFGVLSRSISLSLSLSVCFSVAFRVLVTYYCFVLFIYLFLWLFIVYVCIHLFMYVFIYVLSFCIYVFLYFFPSFVRSYVLTFLRLGFLYLFRLFLDFIDLFCCLVFYLLYVLSLCIC